MKPIDSLGEEISLHRPLCKPLYFHFIYSFYMTKGLVRITCWGENYRCEWKLLGNGVLELTGSQERCWKANGVISKGTSTPEVFHPITECLSLCNMVICMPSQYIHNLQIMNAVFHECTLHQQQKESPLMYSSSHQTTNETPAVVELFMCFCRYNKGNSC